MNCIHHWVIDTPAGPTSFGKCKRCGESKDNFQNAEPKDNYLWDASDLAVGAALSQRAVRMWT